MKFQIPCHVISGVLHKLSGVVAKRQTSPVLGNVLVKAVENVITLAVTDLEVELVVKQPCEIETGGETTIPARKWLDICSSLDEDIMLKVSVDGDRAMLEAGRGRFTLSTLPSTEFPLISEVPSEISFSISQKILKSALEATHFSIPKQDVRYYLNGLMMEMSSSLLRCVATDGHRLAMKDISIAIVVSEENYQVIVPHKGIQELMRLLTDSDDSVNIAIDNRHICLDIGNMKFTSKLVDGRFPDYQRVIPEGGDNVLVADNQLLSQTLTRVAILSNDKYRGIRMVLGQNNLQIRANNSEQEEAEDELVADYTGDEFEIGFNANYLLDAIHAIGSEKVKIILTDSNSSCLIRPPDDSSSSYVVMPMRL